MKMIGSQEVITTYKVELTQLEVDIITAVMGKFNGRGPEDIVAASESLYEVCNKIRSRRHIAVNEGDSGFSVPTMTFNGSEEK
jgi:hypothetical protein